MGYLTIHCDYCKGKWEIYDRGLNKDIDRECPHCGQEIEEQVFSDYVLPAYELMQKANENVFRSHIVEHRPIFTIDFTADHLWGLEDKTT